MSQSSCNIKDAFIYLGDYCLLFYIKYEFILLLLLCFICGGSLQRSWSLEKIWFLQSNTLKFILRRLLSWQKEKKKKTLRTCLSTKRLKDKPVKTCWGTSRSHLSPFQYTLQMIAKISPYDCLGKSAWFHVSCASGAFSIYILKVASRISHQCSQTSMSKMFLPWMPHLTNCYNYHWRLSYLSMIIIWVWFLKLFFPFFNMSGFINPINVNSKHV